MRIAIAGGTGVVGTHVVAVAAAAGHEPIVLSRACGMDLLHQEGLAVHLDGVDVVIDVTSTGTLSSRRSIAFFERVTANLLRAERSAGVRHHVLLSIVGAAQAASGYYAGKAAQERAVTASGDTWSTLRATQFHEFAQQTAARAPILGRHVVPAMRSQPVAAADVAAELLRIAEAGPIGPAPDLAGPREEDMPDMVRRYLRATNRPTRVLRVPLPGRMGRAMRDGGLLPGPDARRTTTTFDDWFAGLG